MATRDILCEVCGDKVGTCAQPDGYPESRWDTALKGYRCDKPACQPAVES